MLNLSAPFSRMGHFFWKNAKINKERKIMNLKGSKTEKNLMTAFAG